MAQTPSTRRSLRRPYAARPARGASFRAALLGTLIVLTLLAMSRAGASRGGPPGYPKTMIHTSRIQQFTEA